MLLPGVTAVHRSFSATTAAQYDVAVVAGRQLGVARSKTDLTDAPYGLSIPSRFNGVGGAMVASETESLLIVTGNDAVKLPSGIVDLYASRDWDIMPITEGDSANTFESSKNLIPIFHDIFEDRGEPLNIVFVSDLIQSLRLVCMVQYQEKLYRKQEKLPKIIRSMSVAVAPRIVASSTYADDIAWLAEYKRERLKRTAEAGKQLGGLLFDPRGKLAHRMTQDRPRTPETERTA